MIRPACLTVCLLVALVAGTQGAALDLPANARMTAERVSARDLYEAPVAPFDGATIPVQAIEGRVIRRAWQIPTANLTPLQVLAPLRQQLRADGYEVILDCAARGCGGFDFRFGIEILPAPAMFVNLRTYHFTTLRQGPEDNPDALVSLLVSTSADAAYLQVIEARAEGAGAGVLAVTRPVAPPTQIADGPHDTVEAADRSLADVLLQRGAHPLAELAFESGATALGPGPFDVLAELAAFLGENPDLRLALVGHTDTVGGLDDNIAISRSRARSVRQRLIDAYGIDPGRLDAEGMGYLAPRASNLSAAGRERNRRVEAVVLPAE